MAFPAVVAQAVTTNSTGALTLPSYSTGDLLVAVSGSPLAPTAPSGWTQLQNVSFGTTTKLGIFAKIGAPGDTFDITAAAGGLRVGGFITSVSGWSGSISDIVSATASGTLNPPSAGTFGSAVDALWLTGAFNFTNLITGAPTNYTNLATTTYSSTTTTDNNQKMAIARRALNATSEDPGVFAGTSNFSGAWTLGIKPVAVTVLATKTGSSTPAGALTGGKKTTKGTFTASSTPGATIAPKTAVKNTQTGSSTPTGLAVKAVTKTNRTGSSTPSGIVTPTKVILLAARTGSTAPSPGIIRPFGVTRNAAGASTPSGLLRKNVTKTNRTGSTTPSGFAPPAHIFNKPLFGSGTPSGLLKKMPVLPRAGSLTPTGALLPKTTTYLLKSTLAPSGSITRLRLPAMGTRVAPARTLNGSGVVGSKVTWEQYLPPGTTATVKTSINGGVTWIDAVNGWPVRDLLPGNTSARAVLTKVILTRPAGVFDLPWVDKLVVDVEENDTRVEWIPLGVFDLTDAEVSDDENGVEITVTGGDLSSRVVANAWEGIFTQPAGANLGEVIKAVLANRDNDATFNFVSTDQVAIYPLTFGARDENNPLQDCADIAVRLGNELYMDAYGVYTMRPEPDPELGDPVFTFSDRVRTVITKLRRRLTKSETKNYIVVTGESAANTTPARGVAYDDDPTSASYYLGRMGKRVLRITSKLVGDDNAAVTMARALLLRRKNLTETVSLSVIPNAAIQESDIVAVDRAVSKLSGNFLVDSMSIPFDAESEMTIEARRQRLAASTPTGSGVGGLDGDPGSGGGSETSPSTFRVAFTSCCNAADSSAYTDIKNAQPDYFFHLGDVWYDDGGSNHVSHWNAQMGATNFAALIAALPNPPVIGWSDHDFGFANNAVGSGNSITATANSAYRTKFPNVTLPANGIYRTWSRGRVRFVYLDCLTFKSPLGTSSSTSRTMLGSTQKTWLKGLLADSAFPMIVVIGDGQWGGPAEDGQDEWRGYDAERKELASAFGASPATVIYLEGDTHSLGIARNKYGIDRIWRASPIYNNTKVKAGGADYDETYPTNANEDATGFHKHYGIIEFADSGNDITATFRGYGDGALQMTDTVTVNAPGGSGGGTVPGGSSVGSLLKIGATTGYNHFNIGIGESAGSHVDHDQASIEAGFTQAGYFELVSGRARLSCHLDGGTTSSNTQYPRTEFREMQLDGTTKAAWNPNASGTRYCRAKGRVTKMPPNKPQLVLMQCHDASDDTVMIYMSSKTTVQAKLGNTVVGTLTSSFAFNTDYVYKIEVVGNGSTSVVKWYWGTTDADLVTPKFTSSAASRSSGWYFKVGAYGQSNTSYDSVSDGPFIVELSKLECSGPGYPTPVGWS